MLALKILINASKMVRAEKEIDTSFWSYYYSLAKSGRERQSGEMLGAAFGFPIWVLGFPVGVGWLALPWEIRSFEEFQMIRANTIRTIVRIICRIARMISCVAWIIVSQSDYC